MFKALDASPASINFSEVYSALQSKVVDGQENPLAIIATAKLYEVQKYCSLTNHMWDGFWFLANGKAWERLPDDLRDDRLAQRQRGRSEGAHRRRRPQRLGAEGARGQGHGVQQPKRRAASATSMSKAGFYAEWKGKFGDEAWAILERNTGKLA